MEKFLFIASPLDMLGELDGTEGMDTKTDVVYIVPSMVRKTMDRNLIALSQGLSSTTVFCMVSPNNFLPSAVFHKLLAKCIWKWQIVEQSGQKQIFSEVCKFNLDQQKHYKLVLVSVGHAVHAEIVSYIDETRPKPELCELVHDFLVEALREILASMGFSNEFRTCIQCPQFSSVASGGYLDMDLMVNQKFITCDECSISHVMLTADLIDCWKEKHPTLPGESLVDQTQTPKKDSDIEKHVNGGTRDTTEGTDFKESLLDEPITQDHLNYLRVCNTLVTVCADGLRDILSSRIPQGYHNFYQLLRASEPALKAMRNLRQEQLDIMFPDPTGRFMGTIDQFDITLLYTLIRNISSVPSHVTGWGNTPLDNPRDTSLGAATERIRICRNCVSGHSNDGQLDDQAFEHYWNDICSMMDDIEQSLGAKGYQDALKKRKEQILSPGEAQALRKIFRALQADVLSTVEIVMEAMRTLQTRAEEYK